PRHDPGVKSSPTALIGSYARSLVLLEWRKRRLANAREDHQRNDGGGDNVERRRQRIAGHLDQPGRDERGESAEDRDRDVVTDRRGGVAPRGRKELRIGGGKGAGKDRKNRHHQELGKEAQLDAAGGSEKEEGIAQRREADAGGHQLGRGAEPVR